MYAKMKELDPVGGATAAPPGSANAMIITLAWTSSMLFDVLFLSVHFLADSYFPCKTRDTASFMLFVCKFTYFKHCRDCDCFANKYETRDKNKTKFFGDYYDGVDIKVKPYCDFEKNSGRGGGVQFTDGR